MRCLDLLLDAGADPTTPFSGTNPEDDYSPLHGALAVAVLNAPISYDKRVKFMFERIIHGSFMALDTATSGPSIWLTAFQWCSPSPELVQSLLDAGCDINETTIDFRNAPDGRNCLFLQVLRAKETGTSLEFATLRFLIRQHANVFAKDANGLTVFDYVNKGGGLHSQYRRDLWYCVLRREGIETGQAIKARPRGVVGYRESYTPEHYGALCYLDTWTKSDLSEQVHDTLKSCPWTQEDALEVTLVPVEREMVRDVIELEADDPWGRMNTAWRVEIRTRPPCGMC
jgi:hypothetical protein